MNSRSLAVWTTVALSSLFVAQAHATTLNFDTLASGVVATNTYAADGVLIDQSLDFLAEANIGLVTGINNDICGQGPTCYNNGYYPTQTQTTFNFSTGVSNLSFFFNNYGDNGISAYYAYDGNTLVSSGNIGLDNGVLEDVSGTGITELVISNNGNDWIYGIDNLSFTAGAVPEPGTFALFGMALLAFGGLSLRRKSS